MKGISQKKLIAITSDIEDAVTQLEELRDNSQEYYDNHNDTWQSGEAGQLFEEALGRLEEQMDALRDISSELTTIGEM